LTAAVPSEGLASQRMRMVAIAITAKQATHRLRRESGSGPSRPSNPQFYRPSRRKVGAKTLIEGPSDLLGVRAA
jgi:hypothetical protein